MAKTIGIGYQDFEEIRANRVFYVDKTDFIREWWEKADKVTLITRPRRFGKTLNMSMVEKFFSVQYKDRADLFQNLKIWEHEEFRNLQGTYPVIFLSFADVKDTSFLNARKKICQIIEDLYNHFDFLLDSGSLNHKEKEFFHKISYDMEDYQASSSLRALSNYLSRYYGKKVIILLDEYDTPMQEAYINGYWEELVSFTRSLFNSTFKTNPYLERAIMTGITRVSKESIFSDLNNLEVVTTTSEKYADSFGFLEAEVFKALDEFGLSNAKSQVKSWYDGFTFGNRTEIYNPWSILNYLDKRCLAPYWANSSSNGLAGKLIREGSRRIKQEFEQLLRGRAIAVEIDEQIVYNQLSTVNNAIWSLLLASGYLKVVRTDFSETTGRRNYHLSLTNKEVLMMFDTLIHNWFSESNDDYNDFIQSLLKGDVKAMNTYMNKVALTTFSYFDTGRNPSTEEPERFYHGFVLGLMVELADRYTLTSNRESGFGRYDVMLEPKRPGDDGIILEFKTQDVDCEKELTDTVKEALSQIQRKKYETLLVEKGIPRENIRKYGFAFCGKTVLIGEACRT